MQRDPGRLSQGVFFFPLPLQHFVHRIMPDKSMAAVNLVLPEYHALSSIFSMAPHKAAPVLRAGLRQGRLLQLFSPALFKHLVQIGTDAQVGILGYQVQG